MALETVDDPRVSEIIRQRHEVSVPPLCPRTSNPVAGSTLTISYRPDGKLLEVYSLNQYVAEFTGSREVRDIEHLVQVVARDCQDVLGVSIIVVGRFVLDTKSPCGVEQVVVCRCRS